MKFKYTALNSKKQMIDGTVEANDRDAAMKAIKKLNYRPISIKKENQGFAGLSFKNQTVKQDEMTIFTRQLSVMVASSVPLIGSLNSLSGKGETHLQKTIKKIIVKIEGGSTLADAMADYPKIFDSIYVNMVRAGESAGILEDILKRLAIQQEKASSIRKKIKSAMAYPTVLMIITVLAFFGLMIFVIPEIAQIIKNMGGEDAELPQITQIMMAISDFIKDKWFIWMPVLGGLIFGFNSYKKTKKGKKNIDRLVLKIPGVGPIVKKIVVARFSRTFSALMGAGVSVINCLEITANAVGNEVYKQALLDNVKQIKNGVQLSEAMKKQGKIWPDIVVQMTAVGEETGNTENILTKVADFYEEEVDLAIEQINSIIEPIMIVIMGSMVALIAASVMSPIANLSNSIK